MDYKLNELLLKTSSQLDDKERDFLRQNVDKLGDEDKAAYSDFLTSEIDSDTENADDGQGEGEDETITPDPAHTDDQPATPAATPYQFKSEEEAREFVKKQVEENEKGKQAAIDAAKTPEEKRYIEENWKPFDWNEGALKIADVVEQRLAEKKEAARKQADDNAKRLDAEWQQISKENNLPGLDTEEGKKVHQSIVQLALKHNKTNFKDAYALWADIPEEKGGGYKIAASDAGAALAAQKKVQINNQRKVAAKLGGQNAGGAVNKGSSPLPPLTYEDMKNKGRVKILREALT